jgi:squalene synthase HpnD
MTLKGPTESDLVLVHESVKMSKSSFYWGMRLLPKAKREAMFALYTLARCLDDIADDPGPLEIKIKDLNAWHMEIDHLYEGKPAASLSRALIPAIESFGLEKEEFHELIRGMEMDVHGPLQAPDTETLMLYCRRAAGTIGLLSISIFGRTDPEARDFALSLSNALQLTNILRDINEDARDNRLYVPRELLSHQGIGDQPIKETLAAPGFSDAFDGLADMAAAWYERADAILKASSAEGLRPAIIMMAIYRRLLERLRQVGWRFNAPKVRIGKGEQAIIAFRNYFHAGV